MKCGQFKKEQICNKNVMILFFSFTPNNDILIKAVSAVRDDRGKGAVQCGPVIYCIEAVDNGDIYSVSLCSELNAQTQYCEECKMNVITADGIRYKDNSSLYYEADEEHTEKLRLRLIPYSCHANRGESDMLVWISIV